MRRFSKRYVRRVTVWLITLAGSSFMVRAAEQFAQVQVQTNRPANIYLLGEPLVMVVRADGPRKFWYHLTDHTGALCRRGALRASPSGPALLELQPLPTGLYTLTIRSSLGVAAREQLAVVPNPDAAGDDRGLFGVNCRPSDDQQWDALARLGVRHLRAEFSWPAVEPSPGQYDLRYVDYVAANARARGLQLTVLTGHTPKFYSTPPVDRSGRVASAWFTWQPADTVEWFAYLKVMAERLLPQRSGGRPLVTAWEVWSEADQNFYYGDWNRYLDMLRVAYCTLKQYDRRVPVVYGSCGHWTEASYTVQSNCQDYFDLMAHHPGGPDPNHALGHWFINMPQVFLKPGSPRETAYTECYFHPTDARYEAGFQLRLFATLKAWRQGLFVRSGCLGAVIGQAGVHEHALLWQDGSKLIPRPAAVGWAVARWLLEDGAYVGPLLTPTEVPYTDPTPGPAQAQVELFVKNGRPLVVGWGDGGSLRLALEPGAQVIDHMGRTRELPRELYYLPLGPNALAVYGVSWRHVAAALQTRCENLLTTELGYQCARNSGYLDPLEVDAAQVIAPGFGDQVRAAVQKACRRLSADPESAPAQLFQVQRLLGEGMIEAARRCQQAGRFTPTAANTIWRLAQYCEELGHIADDLGRRWPRERSVGSGEVAELAAQIAQVRSASRRRSAGAECPFAERLLDRAEAQLDLVSDGGGRGAWWAALMQMRAAQGIARVEPPQLRRVFAVVTFATGEAFTKATVLRPSTQHQAQVRVYNFLDRPVSGTLALSVPTDWGAPQPTGGFTAPAGGYSELVNMTFSVPEEPRPWVVKAAYRPCGELPVALPAPLAPNIDAWIGGQLGAGATLPDMKYRLCVGAYSAGGGEIQLASR